MVRIMISKVVDVSSNLAIPEDKKRKCHKEIEAHIWER